MEIQMSEEGFERLKNEIIVKVERSEDNTVLRFTTDLGDVFSFYANGDCCSSSWFNNLSGINNLLNYKIREVENKEEKKPSITDANDETGAFHECLQFYGFTLKTNAGYVDIEMRNSSNGYYGGWVSSEKSKYDFKGDDSKFKEVTEDF